ncbi:calcium-binding protein [Aeromicrobium sp. A1-2]|uniref:GmrSD restriction endonuclease domain-containing protein n=1 Tax=Aeromicrobium sp. A1-2 TaxID=2107713 RepID=UPI000E4C5AC2|nr:DUF1524 domain-containing protein [Aeromicrobium sp. A1-2]AXT86847.1 calcium-binding protein [Aeromicrobium sp. A1-2]
MSHPAGWYPTDDGVRYWDGSRWTEHFAPVSSPATPSQAADAAGRADLSPDPHRVGRVRSALAIIFGWGGLILVAVLGGASSGASGLFILSGLYVLVVAVVALIRGRVGWARLRGRAAGGIALAAALGLFIAGGATADPPADPPVTAPASTTTPTPTPTPAPAPSATKPTVSPKTAGQGTALAAVASLAVKGRAPKTGYSRDAFGQAWFDADRNGCDTRNDILRRDLTDRDMENYCKALAGTLDPDPYTGTMIRFQYGGASEVDIDHVVALSDAWQKGAGKWAAEKRLAFANDPLNLLAVDAGANRAKGDGDAATWLPPNKPYRCEYVARQVAVKSKYDVWVTSAELDAMVRVLSSCVDMLAPAPGPAPTAAALPKSKPKPTTPAPARKLASTPEAPASTFYANCTAVRAAGAAPIRRGQAGYSRKLDRDGDGIACE